METIKVQIRKISGNEDLPLPEYMTHLAAGMDLFAAVPSDEMILPGQRRKVPTGIAISLPEGYEAQIRPRSGLAIHQGITLLNAPGTIDADYRGEVAVLLINLGKERVVIHHGDRIAQLVVAPCVQASFLEASHLDATERGSGGFGSTGV